FAFQHGGGSPAPTFVSDPADGEPVRPIRYGADQQRPAAGHEHATPGGEGGGGGRRGRDRQDAAEHARGQRLGVGVDGAARRGRAGELGQHGVDDEARRRSAGGEEGEQVAAAAPVVEVGAGAE